MTLGGKFRYYLQLSAEVHRNGNCSLIRQFVEMIVVFIVTGNGPGFYHMAGLYRRSITWRYKVGHLNGRRYRRRVRSLNPDDYRKLSQNKLAEKAILSSLGFPVVKFLGYYHPRYGRTATGNRLTNGIDILKLFESERCLKACFKPLEGWAGRGFQLIEVLDGGFANRQVRRLTVDPESIDIDTFLGRYFDSDGCILEEYFVQHPILSKFNSSSVNTYRIWVAENASGVMHTLFGYLRIGRAGSRVDNQSSGGIVAPIDLNSGVTGVAIDGRPSRREFRKHPDHGAVIEGVELPFWTEAKILAENCLAVFPNLRFAGLDVAVGKHGPTIIELNVSPDKEGAAFSDMPTKYILPTKRRG